MAAFCNQCQSYTVIFDMISNEFVCSSCGCVVADELSSSEHSGNFPARTCRWAMQSNYGYSPSTASSHTIDSDGNIYLAANLGDFAQVGAGSASFVNPGVSKGYLFRISPGGNFQWANPLHSVNTYDMTYGADGNIYLTGLYYSLMQYQSYQKATPMTQSLILKINRGGSFLGAFTSETLEDPSTPYGSDSHGHQSVVDANGDIYMMGSFREGLTFNCLPATVANYSFYLVKFEKPVAPPLAITGPNDSYCEAASLTLSATLIPGADYAWFIPDGATSASPPTGGQVNLNITSAANQRAVMVSVSDGCVQYFSDPYTLQISTRPASPRFATAESLVCAGTSETYSILEVANADQIEWTMPSGISATPNGQPSSMALHFSESFLQGNITVTAKNQCGESSSGITYRLIRAQANRCSPDMKLFVHTCRKSIQMFRLSPALYRTNGSCRHSSHRIRLIRRIQTSCMHKSFTSLNQVRYVFARLANVMPVNCQIPSRSAESLNREELMQSTGPDQICAVNNDVQYQVAAIPNATQYVWNVSGPFNLQGEITSETNSLELKATGKGTGSVTVYALNECGEEGGSAHIDILSFESLPIPKLEKGLCDSEITVTLADSVLWFRNGIHLPGLYQKKIEGK